MDSILTRTFKSNLKLQSERTHLVPAKPELATERYLTWLQDPQINRFLETRWQEQSIDSIKAFIAERDRDKCAVLFAIVDKDTSQHIGNIKLGPINWHHRFAEISYFIGEKQYWNKGYASEVIATVANWGLDQLELALIKAGFYGSNTASKKALEKAGFSFEANFRGEFVDIDGSRVDHLWYSKRVA